MIPIKILCGCGQKYAFEVEPIAGQMPWVVTCPICGVDGTAAANMAIAQSLQAQAPVIPAPAPAALRVSSSPPAAAPPAPAVAPVARPPASKPVSRKLLPGQIDPAQAEVEAKAKISWGDPPEQVMSYLMIQGFSREDATAMVQQMFNERAITIRRNGIGKMMVGTGMLFVPVVAYLVLVSMGMSFGNAFFPIKLYALTVMVGLWGAWKFVKGIFMILAPRSEAGDVATH